MLSLNKYSKCSGTISTLQENAPDAINRIALSEKKAQTNSLLAQTKKPRTKKSKKMMMKILNKKPKLNNSKMNSNSPKKKENKNI